MPGASGRNQLLNISVDGRGGFTSDVLIRIGWGTPAQGKGTEDAQVQLRRADRGKRGKAADHGKRGKAADHGAPGRGSDPARWRCRRLAHAAAPDLGGHHHGRRGAGNREQARSGPLY